MNKDQRVNWLLLLASIFSSLLLAEIIARHIPRSVVPEIYSRRTPVYRPELGIVTNRPGSCQVVSSSWVYNEVCFNKYGFRGTDWQLDKKQEEIRVAVLGDSYVEGLQVAFDELASTRLEKLLGSRFTVLNFGLSGTGHAEQLLIYRNLVKRFRPDIVISVITPSNDFEDNVRDLSKTREKPFLEMENGHLVEIPLSTWTTLILSPKVSELTSWFGNLALFKLVAYRLLAQAKEFSLFPFSPGNAWAAQEDSTLTPLKEFTTPAYDYSKQVMGAALLRLKETCEKEGTQFVLVSTSGVWTFLAQENRAFLEKAEMLALRYNWIEEFVKKHGISYLDLNKALLGEYLARGFTAADIHIPWDGHWTPLGNRLVAEHIHDFLREASAPSIFDTTVQFNK
jgi:hypothetical protein